MTREDYRAKARRLLVDGRVSIISVFPGGWVRAIVRGDTAGMYEVRFRDGVWSCTCPAASRCSHVFAVQRVVVVDLPPDGAA